MTSPLQDLSYHNSSLRQIMFNETDNGRFPNPKPETLNSKPRPLNLNSFPTPFACDILSYGKVPNQNLSYIVARRTGT